MLDDYHFGRVCVDGTEHEKDLIVYRGESTSWWRAEGHSVCMDDVGELVARGPEVIVFGTGAYGMMRVPDAVRRALEQQGIEVVAQPTAEAVATYNKLVEAGRDAAVAMHLTC